MRFAYLIMAHHKFEILKLLLEELDDERNDIFLHIDKKTKEFDESIVRNSVHKSNLFMVRRVPVYWGDFSQVKCEMNLLRAATHHAHYDYYHLLVGVEFPLKSQDVIHSFFEKNRGYEFVGFDNVACITDRIRYYYFLKKYVRYSDRSIKEDKLDSLGDYLLEKQRQWGINRIRHHEEEYKKGYANWSITDRLARYIVSKKREIRKHYKYTYCSDEIFVQTLVYNSDFFEKVFDREDEYRSVMRLTSWDDMRNQMHMSDLQMLLKTDRLFARKFDDDDAIEIINQLIKYR